MNLNRVQMDSPQFYYHLYNSLPVTYGVDRIWSVSPVSTVFDAFEPVTEESW